MSRMIRALEQFVPPLLKVWRTGETLQITLRIYALLICNAFSFRLLRILNRLKSDFPVLPNLKLTNNGGPKESAMHSKLKYDSARPRVSRDSF